jgi:hypothetical protein
MKQNTMFFAAAAVIVFAALSGPQTISIARAAGCEAGDRIDGSSTAKARKAMEGAGFHQVHHLVKGCDNFWHGIAAKDGIESRVVVTPQGQVMREGD